MEVLIKDESIGSGYIEVKLNKNENGDLVGSLTLKGGDGKDTSVIFESTTGKEGYGFAVSGTPCGGGGSGRYVASSGGAPSKRNVSMRIDLNALEHLYRAYLKEDEELIQAGLDCWSLAVVSEIARRRRDVKELLEDLKEFIKAAERYPVVAVSIVAEDKSIDLKG